MLLVAAGLLGFISVAFGAYAEHALRPVVEAETFRALMTAVRYNQIHAVATLGVAIAGVTALAPNARNWLRLAGWGFVIGAVLFSGGIYLAAVLDTPGLMITAPFGGVTLMLAWVAVVIAGAVAIRAETR